MSEKVIWKTPEEAEAWLDAYYEQQTGISFYQYDLDCQVNELIAGGMEYPEAFDKIYTIDVLKKLNLLPSDFEETEDTMSMSEVLADIDDKYTVMVEKPTNELTNSEE